MTQEEKRTLEAELEALKGQEENLLNELDGIMQSKKLRNLKKVELQREVTIRRELDEVETRGSEIEQKLNNEKVISRRRFFTSLSIIALAGILGVVIGRTSRKSCAPIVDSIVDRSISTKATPTPTPLLVDPKDEEDVRDTAEVIYEENIEPMLNKINSNGLQQFFTREAVEDIIRMVNGELPKYSNYDEYTIGETANLMNDIFANQGNKNNLYPMDFSKLYPTGSNEAEYVKTYDDIYRQIAKYRVEGNVDGFVEQCGLLASKVYNEWHLAGLYGGWNPYLFSSEKQYFLLQATTSRFSNYVREYLESNGLTVCIPACYDVDVEGYKLVEIRDIFEALYMGTSKNGEISVLRSGEVVNLFGETFADAKNYFDARANTKVKGLN